MTSDPRCPLDIDALARRLDEAQTGVTDTPSLSDDHELTVDNAYAVQSALITRREHRGETVVGVKLGFTSKAKMAQMGVSEVIVGRLTDVMAVADGGKLELGPFIHPRIEPEVAYRLGRDVDLDDAGTSIESCVDAIAPAMEIIDSRYRDFRFTYTDVVADNTSAAAFVIGPWQPVHPVADRAVRMRVAGVEVVGSTAAILGNPVRALHALAGICVRRRIPLRAGQVILAGAATAALPLGPGAAECDIAGLGRVTVEVTR
ncbi:2-keto-4-pentenoate hydratase [Nocardia sp. NBC_00416]|uniref:2-keto-4-pentenoate hydratase n=1 Tax=Nocardia sp. NBC_00416 TaxID=2975991 RepID=UPI002E2409FC